MEEHQAVKRVRVEWRKKWTRRRLRPRTPNAKGGLFRRREGGSAGAYTACSPAIFWWTFLKSCRAARTGRTRFGS
jgi:hypothetical protein